MKFRIAEAVRTVLTGLCLALLSASTHAWWNEEWGFRKQLDIDTSASGIGVSQPIVGAPVLVRLHAGNFQYFGDMQPSGADLRFIAADDVTPLPFHVERFDPVGQVALIWVQVPNLLPGMAAQTLYMYYGNAAAPVAGNAGQTYDKDMGLVLHMDAQQGLQDATAYAVPINEQTATPEPLGIIGSALRFEPGQQLRFGSAPTLAIQPQRGWTLSVWVKAATAQTSGALFRVVDPINGELSLLLDGLTPTLRYQAAAVDSLPQELGAQVALVPGTWTHLGVQIRGQETTFLVDGQVAGEAMLALPALSGRVILGTDSQEVGLSQVTLDELQLSNTARSVDWFKLQAGSQSMDAMLLRYGEDSQSDDGETESHFTTTLRNVDWGGFEGIIIFVCLILAVFSWYVMLQKGLHLRRVGLANERFRQGFRETEELMALGEQGTRQYRPSTLAELYNRAHSEIDKRIAVGSVGAASANYLSPEALAAIRANVNAENVGISQQLNKLMVFLTLAIAGGPFLGLLGTVVGVMVTFAGIAASGDVNINAIAPGIAAALVATVAGLVVAIPALFGYNYLSTQLKEIVTENNVFAEELMANTTESFAS